MSEEKIDRRIQRTRQVLKQSLLQLIHEKGYDAVTIQDITDRANLGRTTFYLHYQSKDDLLLDHHAELLNMMNMGRWSREELLSEVEASGLIEFLRRFAGNHGLYMAIIKAKDSDLILRGMQAQMVTNLSESLALALPDHTSRMPLVVLCNYIVGAQLALIRWWMTTRNDYEAVQIAHMIQQLQYVAIKDAYRLGNPT